MIEAQKYADLHNYLKTVSKELFCIIKQCMEQFQEYSQQLSTRDSIIAQMLGSTEDLWSRLICGATIRELRQKYQYVSDQTFKVMLELHLLKHIRRGSSAPLQYLLPHTQHMPVQSYRANTYSLSTRWKQHASVIVANQPIHHNPMLGNGFFSYQDTKAVVPSPLSSNHPFPGSSSSKKEHIEPIHDPNSGSIGEKKIIRLRPNKKSNKEQIPALRILNNVQIEVDRAPFSTVIPLQRSIDEDYYHLIMQKFNAEDEQFFYIQDMSDCQYINSMVFTENHTNFCFNLVYQYVLQEKEQLDWSGGFQKKYVPFYLRWIVGGKTRGTQVGSISPASVKNVLGHRAILAACSTNLLTLQEIQDVQVEITWFTKVTQKRGIFDWTLGHDGIYIDCYIDNVHLQSCLLPWIINERKLSKKKAIQLLLRRAGYEGDLAKILKQIRLSVFESETIRMHYKDTRLRLHRERPEAKVREERCRNKRALL